MGPCKSTQGVSDTSKKPKYEFYKGYKTADDLKDFDQFFGGAERLPFGIEAKAFFGNNPEGSPQEARHDAEIIIENMPQWENAATFTRKEKNLWKSYVQRSSALKSWPKP